MTDPNEVIVIHAKEGDKGFNTPDKRKELARKIQNLADAGKMELAGQTKRYQRNQKYYENNPDFKTDLPFKNAADHHSPLVQPILDMVVETVVQPLIQADPPISAKAAGEASQFVNIVESDVSYLMTCGAWDRALYDAALVSAIAGMAMVRVPFAVVEETFPYSDEVSQPGRITYAGPEFEVYHPSETFIHPLSLDDPSRAAIVGHKIEVRIQEVREKQKVGAWFNDEVIGQNPDAEAKAGQDSDSNLQSKIDSEYKENHLVNLYCGLVKLDLDKDGFEEVYEFVIAPDQLLLLDLKIHDLRMIWYADGRMTTEHNSFYPSHSIADSLQSLQSYYNELHNKLLDATDFATGPVIFQLKGAGDSDTETYSPYTVNYVDVMPEIAQVKTDVNIAPIVMMIGQVEKQAYAVAGLGNNDQGQAMPGERTTATEAARVASFSSRRTAGYREKLSNLVEKMAYLTLEHYRNNYELLKQVHGDQLKCENKEILAYPYRFKVSGASLNNSPVQQLEGIRALLEIIPALQAIDPTVVSRVDASKLLGSIINAVNLPMGDAIIRDAGEADLQNRLMVIGQNLGTVDPTKPETVFNAIQQISQALTAPPSNPGGDGGNVQQPGMAYPPEMAMQGMSGGEPYAETA